VVHDTSLVPVLILELAEHDKLEGLGRRRDIVRVYRRQLRRAPYYIEYEWVAGDNLAVWGLEQGHLHRTGAPHCVQLFLQIARAVEAAHSVGARHMNIRPENILVIGGTQEPWQVKLTGFGRQHEAPQGNSIGSRLYLAPELQHDWGAPATLASDVYSLGVVLLQMLTGNFSLAPHPGFEEYIDHPQLRACVIGACHVDLERRMNVSRLIEALLGRGEPGPGGGTRTALRKLSRP
jgi:eukaryotic-like serine/threonine-protein kinase